MRIRAGEPSDAAFIVAMAQLASVIEDDPPPPADDPALLLGLPPSPDTAVVAVDHDGRPIGAAWWHVRDRSLVVTQDGAPVPEVVVGVLPAARGSGVGRRLLDALAARAAERGHDRLALNVHIRNPAARLYSRAGFVVAGKGRGPLGVAMVRELRWEGPHAVPEAPGHPAHRPERRGVPACSGGLRRVPPVQQPADLETVRESYDRVADAYVELAMGRLEEEPWLRAVLAAFAEAVRGLGPVLDVGCGPGTVTAHLSELGLDVAGVDLSPRMVAHARRQYPDLRFSVASATQLDVAPASLGGVLGWWSLFNLPRAALPAVLRTFAAALVPGGQALVGTHVGEGDVQRTEGYGGLPVSWTTHLYRPEELAAMVVDAGLEVVAELRLPVHPPSMRPQVLLAARRPA